MNFDWTQGALAEGLQHYHAGDFFAAHESWESLWMVAQEPDKMFLQGLIQVTAAFHHLQRNNPREPGGYCSALWGASSVILPASDLSRLPCSAMTCANG